MSDARRDGLAHRFVANVLPETTTWPPLVQLALYQLAFSTLPQIILELDADGARNGRATGVDAWRTRRIASSYLPRRSRGWKRARASGSRRSLWLLYPKPKPLPPRSRGSPIDNVLSCAYGIHDLGRTWIVGTFLPIAKGMSRIVRSARYVRFLRRQVTYFGR